MELRESRCQGWAEYCAEQVAAGSGTLYKLIREGSKAFVLPRCDPEWRGTEEQQEDNPPPGLAARQAGIEKTWWQMWDPAGQGGEPGHSN
eukprot:1761202-Heterocapsa_arctica.AAC.1